jgi:hypothetical protein
VIVSSTGPAGGNVTTNVAATGNACSACCQSAWSPDIDHVQCSTAALDAAAIQADAPA